MNRGVDKNSPTEAEVEIPVVENGNPQNVSGSPCPAQERLIGNGCSRVEEPCGSNSNKKWVIIVTLVLVVLLMVSVGFNITQRGTIRQLQAQLQAQLPTSTQPPIDTPCPEGWKRNKTMCYFFSAKEGTWNSSQSHCSSYGGSLVALDTQQEMDAVKDLRDPTEYWIHRDSVKEPWKWSNGSLVGDWFQIRGEGLCAYLNENEVMSTNCDGRRNWICKKPVLAA